MSELRARYEREGYVTAVDVFGAHEMATYRAAFDELEAREGKERAQVGLERRHFQEQFVWDMATDPRLVAVMRDLVGEDLLLMSTHFFCKYPDPEATGFVAWHQDVTYWGLEPPEAHTAWIAVDRSDVGNGCMEVIPGSHRGGIVEHGTSTRAGNLLSIEQEIPAHLVDAPAAVPLELEPGQISVHDGHLVHGSHPNRSDRRRCGLTVRFIRPEVRQVAANSVGRDWEPVLVSGEDRYGHFELAEPPFALHP